MEQNKTGKYFKYAIGEIVLVVIGILIALSINNWNEGKKAKEKEKQVLTEIISDLLINFLFGLLILFNNHSELTPSIGNSLAG